MDSSDVVQIGQQCGVLSSSSPISQSSVAPTIGITPTISEPSLSTSLPTITTTASTAAISIANSHRRAHIFKALLNLYGMIMILWVGFAIV
jgi:hypothetical protein